MSAAEITPQQIIDAIQRVPADRMGDVLQAIERLQSLAPAPAPLLPPVRTGADLRGSELIGIWADRPEVHDTRNFTQELRDKSDQRRREGPLNAAGH